MKKVKINYGLIIFIIIVVILFIPIIMDYINSRKITILKSDELVEKIESKESFLLYVGEADNNVIKGLRKIRDKKKMEYSYEYDVYSIEDSENVDALIGSDTKLVFVIEGDIQRAYTEYDYKKIDNASDVYFIGNINDENRSFKVAENFNAYKNLVNSDEVTMAIFGYSECYHCNVFKPIYNAVAEKYGVDIYYFESDTYDKDEYKKIVNIDLTVPGKCNSYGNEFKLSDGFGTPLTIFTQDGEVIDCMAGRVDRDALIDKLISLGMISE